MHRDCLLLSGKQRLLPDLLLLHHAWSCGLGARYDRAARQLPMLGRDDLGGG